MRSAPRRLVGFPLQVESSMHFRRVRWACVSSKEKESQRPHPL